MLTRPSRHWRDQAGDQRRSVAAGTLTEADAYAVRLWPEAFTAAVDTALDAYEREVRALGVPSDEEAFGCVERVVTALNAIDGEHGAIETDEREELCEYVDAVLTAAGVDVTALTARHGLDRSALTDRWRDW